MGKNKGDRVKGNAQASSSSRAAELLAQQGFSGFTGFSSTPELEIETLNDGNLRVLLKKLQKRDGVTRLKAIDELNGYLTENVEEIDALLSTWPSLFDKLSLDVERRVREGATQVHLLIIRQVGRRLANILKEIAGPWLACFFDPSHQVVKLAKEAWQTAFVQPAKQQEALQFVHQDVIRYISRILLQETPESLADPRFHTPDEIQAKYARAVSCSLASLGYLSKHVKLSLEDFDKLLDSDKFWTFLTHANPIIRKAAYGFLVQLAHNAPDSIQSHLVQITPQFPGKSFSDKDVSTHADLWDAMVAVTSVAPLVWTMGKKPMIPKLFTFLKAGGYGSIQATYPSLLPLLAHLPDEITLQSFQDLYTFYPDFMAYFWNGLDSGFVDVKNGNIFLTSYLESLVYILQRMSKLDTSAAKRTSTRLHQDLIKVLESHLLPHTHLETKDKWSSHHGSIELGKALSRLSSFQDNFTELQQILTKYMIQDPGNDLTEAQFDLFCHRAGEMLLAVRQTASEKENVVNKIESISESLSREILPRMVPENAQRAPALADFASHVILAQPTLLPSLRQSLDDFVDRMGDFISTKSIPTSSITKTLDLVLADLEASESQWPKVVKAVLQDSDRSMELMANLLTKVDGLKLSQNDDLENFVQDAVAYQVGQTKRNKDLEVVISKALFSSPPLISDSTVKFALQRFSTSLGQFVKDYFLVQPPLPHKVYAKSIWSAESLIRILSSLESCKRDLTGFNLDTILVELWDVASYGPSLDDRRVLVEVVGDAELDSLSPLARDAWDVIQSRDGFDFDNLAKAITKRMMDNLGNLAHVGVAKEFVGQVERLLRLPVDQGVILEGLVKEEDWNHAISPFITESSLLSIVGEGVLRPSPGERKSLPTSAERDVIGHSLFARRLMFTLGLIRQVGIDYWFDNADHAWLIPALIHAKLVLEDGQRGFVPKNKVDKEDLDEVVDSILSSKEPVDVSRLLSGDEHGDQVLVQSIHSLVAKHDKTSARVLHHLAKDMVSGTLNTTTYPDNVALGLAQWTDKQTKRELIEDPTWLHLAMFNEAEGETGDFGWLESVLQEQQVWTRTEVAILLNRMADEFQDWSLVEPYIEKWLSTEPKGDGLVLLYHTTQLIVSMQGLGLPTSEETWQRLLEIVMQESLSHEDDAMHAFQDVLSESLMSCPSTLLSSQDTFVGLLNTIEITKNESIQKLCVVLLRRHVIDKVQSLSLKLELRRKPEGEDLEVEDRSDEKSLPQNLLTLCQTSSSTPQLFAWLVLLDHLEDATFELRSSYISHIRNTDKLLSNFLDGLFVILGVAGQEKPFDLSQWDFAEYDVRGFDGSEDWSRCLLAAHLYWRVLRLMPSLTRLWWSDVRDRSHSLAVESYTEKYFTPLLINTELEQVTKAGQLDEKTSIKVSRATREVSAVYHVEDNVDLNLSIRFPNNFPLKPAEVDSLGSAKAGLKDERSKAWTLGVSSVMFAQNGTALDALTIWNRNVTLHYAGIEDCTICYSIVGTLDRSLPTRQCKTCKNKFHAACLLKWFKSSGQSTCPLCRSQL